MTDDGFNTGLLNIGILYDGARAAHTVPTPAGPPVEPAFLETAFEV